MGTDEPVGFSGSRSGSSEGRCCSRYKTSIPRKSERFRSTWGGGSRRLGEETAGEGIPVAPGKRSATLTRPGAIQVALCCIERKGAVATVFVGR